VPAQVLRERRGGYNAQADRGKTFVQQPNGILETGKNPEPGAVVVVP